MFYSADEEMTEEEKKQVNEEAKKAQQGRGTATEEQIKKANEASKKSTQGRSSAPPPKTTVSVLTPAAAKSGIVMTNAKSLTNFKIGGIKEKEQKISDTILLFKYIQEKRLNREKLTPFEKRIDELQSSYGTFYGAKEAIKMNLV